MGVVDASATARDPVLPRGGTSAGGSADPAEHVLRVLMSGAHRKGSLARSELERHRTVLLQVIRRHTVAGQPVPLTLMAFPFKVPNPLKVGRRTLPDLAELTALKTLGKVRDAVASVYPPSLVIDLILDGNALAPVVGLSRAEVAAYHAYLSDLARSAGVAEFVTLHDFDVLVASTGKPSVAQVAAVRSAARSWWDREHGGPEWQLAFRRMLGMINVRDVPVDDIARAMTESAAGRLSPDLSQLERRVWRAMIDYRVFDSVVHDFDPRPVLFPNALHATTQERPGRLSIWLIRRGRSHLPWHGVGVVDDDGTVRVMTHAQVMASNAYEPITRDGEKTPFYYRTAKP